MYKDEFIASPLFMPARHAFQELLGQTITRVSIEPWSVRLLFGTGELHIEGTWRLTASDQSVVDQSQEFSGREKFELWRIVNSTVEAFRFWEEPLPGFAIEVTGQWTLEVQADDSGFEDWSLIATDVWVVCNGNNITTFSGGT